MKKKPYSLVELLAVIAVMGIMMSTSISIYSTTIKTNTKMDNIRRREIKLDQIALKIRNFAHNSKSLMIQNELVLEGKRQLIAKKGSLVFTDIEKSETIELPENVSIYFTKQQSHSGKDLLVAHIKISKDGKEKNFAVKACIGSKS
jgi:hypothetical protein